MITHIRTPYRLIPTALVGEFRQLFDHPSEVLITDPWSTRYARTGGSDVVALPSPAAARAACERIRQILAVSRSHGPYVRLVPPGLDMMTDRLKWYVVIEDHRAGGIVEQRAYKYSHHLQALAAFEEIARSLASIDVAAAAVAIN